MICNLKTQMPLPSENSEGVSNPKEKQNPAVKMASSVEGPKPLSRYYRYKESYDAYRKNNVLRLKLIGKKHRDIKYFSGLRRYILKRDKYTCQECGMTNKEHFRKYKRSITIDHIDGNGRYSKIQNNSPDNLITLCLPCHGRKDKIRALISQK